jgi:hypothetical protein
MECPNGQTYLDSAQRNDGGYLLKTGNVDKIPFHPTFWQKYVSPILQWKKGRVKKDDQQTKGV